MKKRILALFLLIVLSLSLVACGGDPVNTDPGSDSNIPVSSSGNTDSESSDSNSSDKGNDKEVEGYDPSIEHKFLACDIRNHSIVVFDLNAVDGDPERLTEGSAVFWEWVAKDDPNLKTGGPGYGIDSAKYRYSPVYEKDVIIACSSNGWCGIIDYEAKTLLWEHQLRSGPHSVEMLPNGDLVVASSFDPGALYYFALSAGINEPVHSIPMLYGHGVSWDPENECLWVLGYHGVSQVLIQNMGTENAKLMSVSGIGCSFMGDSDGHAFSPISGDPGKYWVAGGGVLWKFDAEKETMTRANAVLTSGGIKGVCSFSDGTVIQAIAGLCKNNKQWFGSDGLRIIVKKAKAGKVKETAIIVPFTDREFYKVQPFTKDYQ